MRPSHLLISAAALCLASVAASAADDGCRFDGTGYSHGATACQSGTQYRCDDGEWTSLAVACPAPAGQPVSAPVGPRTCMLEGATVSSSSTVCKAGEMHVCEDGQWRNLGAACK